MSPRIGLALGGGGARGLGHIPVIEALDEMGVRPVAVTGTSIGAIMGCGVAAGMSGAELRGFVLDAFGNRGETLSRLWRLRPGSLTELLQPRITQFDPERVLGAFLPETLPATFDDLQIPLTVVASDFFGWEGVSINSGPLVKGVAASAALPVLFSPVHLNGRYLIDGGAVNPLPFDLLPDDLDLVVAVDVVGGPEPRDLAGKPSNAEIMFGTAQLILQTIVREKLKNRRPDVLVRPDINAFRVLDFLKADAVLKAADPVKEQVKQEVAAALEKADSIQGVSSHGENVATP